MTAGSITSEAFYRGPVGAHTTIGSRTIAIVRLPKSRLAGTRQCFLCGLGAYAASVFSIEYSMRLSDAPHWAEVVLFLL
jgi:hypothetical protein